MGKMTEKRENKKDSTRKKRPAAGRIEILLIALCVAGCILTGEFLKWETEQGEGRYIE